jgi:hypothetical protein
VRLAQSIKSRSHETTRFCQRSRLGIGHSPGDTLGTISLSTGATEGWSMAPSSRQPARRTITTAGVGLAALGLLVSCGADTSPSSQSKPATAVDQSSTSPPTSDSGEVRLGCGTYCQSAGGLAGTVPPGQDAVTIVSSGTLTLGADGYLSVTLTCNLSVQCKGSLVVQGVDEEDPDALGRSDLLVNAGATATLGVGLPDRLVADIRAHNPPCPPPPSDPYMVSCPAAVFVISDIGPSFGCAGKAEGTGLPYCGGPVNGFRVVSFRSLRVVAPG